MAVALRIGLPLRFNHLSLMLDLNSGMRVGSPYRPSITGKREHEPGWLTGYFSVARSRLFQSIFQTELKSPNEEVVEAPRLRKFYDTAASDHAPLFPCPWGDVIYRPFGSNGRHAYYCTRSESHSPQNHVAHLTRRLLVNHTRSMSRASGR